MKIAIPTNDKQTIAKRSGQAKWFGIFEIENSVIISQAFLENNHEHHHHHDHEEGEHTHEDMIALLKDCSLMIAQKVGPHFGRELKGAKIDIKLTELENIDEALKLVL
ncbi:MAG: hypothetical protein JXR60_02510 [Bacteroidales bacterium]|nr:hypothetical protein [Bacteroidales bacterium]